MDAAYAALVADVGTCVAFEGLLSGKGGSGAAAKVRQPTTARRRRRQCAQDQAGALGRVKAPAMPAVAAAAVETVRSVVGALATARKRPPPGEPLDDASLSKKARFTDRFAPPTTGPFCGTCRASSTWCRVRAGPCAPTPVDGSPRRLAGDAGRGRPRARLGLTLPLDRHCVQVQWVLLRSDGLRCAALHLAKNC